MDYLMINTYLELNNLDENDIYKYSNKYYKIALAFYTSFHYLMKVNVKSIKNITYGTNVNNEILKKLFNIENCNIEEYYKKIIKSIDINVLLNSDSVKDYNEKLIIIETLNVKDDINIKKIIPFSYYFVIYDDKHINELLVYFEYKNEIYFLYLRLTIDMDNIKIYPFICEKINNNIEDDLINFGKKQMNLLDIYFTNYAKINTQNNNEYYRGMCKPYLFPFNNKIVINDFTSLTKYINIAKTFMGNGKGYLYKIIIDSGIPYIDNSNIALINGENEIILPRKIILTKIKDKNIIFKDGTPITVIRVSFSYPEIKIY